MYSLQLLTLKVQIKLQNAFSTAAEPQSEYQTWLHGHVVVSISNGGLAGLGLVLIT